MCADFVRRWYDRIITNWNVALAYVYRECLDLDFEITANKGFGANDEDVVITVQPEQVLVAADDDLATTH